MAGSLSTSIAESDKVFAEMNASDNNLESGQDLLLPACDIEASHTGMTTSRSRLLDIPLELRNMIYGYMLTLDRSLEHIIDEKREKTFNLGLLHLNRQMRMECWDVLVNTNIWITVTLLESLKPPVRSSSMYTAFIESTSCQPHLWTTLLTITDVRRLKSSAAIRIWLGDPCGTDTEDYLRATEQCSVLFAFHPRNYGLFCCLLAARVDRFRNITIDINPKPSAFPNYIMKHIIQPLTMIRGAKKACFQDLMHVRQFRDLAKIMVTRITTNTEVCNVLESYVDISMRSMGCQKYLEAMLSYWDGRDRFRRVLLRTVFNRGARRILPESSNINRVLAELNLGITTATNHLVAARRINNVIVNRVNERMLEKSVRYATEALDWLCISDAQRQLAYYQRAIAIANLGDYTLQSMEKDRGSWSCRECINLVQTYAQAGFDLYFAKEVHVDGQLQTRAQEQWEVMCDKTRQLAGDCGLTKTRISLGIDNKFKDDSLDKMEWVTEAPRPMTRRRTWNKLDQPITDDELRTSYAAVGISMEFGNDGRVHIYLD